MDLSSPRGGQSVRWITPLTSAVPATAMGQARRGAGLSLAVFAGAFGLRAKIKTDPGLPADTTAVVNGQAISRHRVEMFLKNDRKALGLTSVKEADRARRGAQPDDAYGDQPGLDRRPHDLQHGRCRRLRA